MIARCFQRDCAWTEEVEHMDEAIASLRVHTRDIHPTKHVSLENVGSWLEQWNRTSQDWLDWFAIVLPDDDNQLPQGRWYGINDILPRDGARLNGYYVNPEVEAELRVYAERWNALERGQDVMQNAIQNAFDAPVDAGVIPPRPAARRFRPMR